MTARSLPESDPGPVRAISWSSNEIAPRLRCRADRLRPDLDHLESWSLALSGPLVSSAGHFQSWDSEGPLPDLFIEGAHASEVQTAGAKACAFSGALALAAEPENREEPGPWYVRPLGAFQRKAHRVVAR